MKRYRTPRELLSEVAQVLAAKTPPPGRSTVLQQLADLLGGGRHYLWTGIYLVVGKQVVCQAAHGPECSRPSVKLGDGIVGAVAQSGDYHLASDVSNDKKYLKVFPETRSELAVPVKIGGHVLGVINVESAHVNGIASEDRVLLQQTAHQLALFLANRGKYLLMKAREVAGMDTGSTQQHDRPITAPLKVADIPFLKPERVSAASAGEPIPAGDRSRK